MLRRFLAVLLVIGGFLLTIPLAMAAVILLAVAAVAHTADKGWTYPWECCSDQDCWENGAKSEPDPVQTPAGWRLYDGTVVPFADTRPSPDGAFHTCRKAGSLAGAVIKPEGKKTCLWVPSLT